MPRTTTQRRRLLRKFMQKLLTGIAVGVITGLVVPWFTRALTAGPTHSTRAVSSILIDNPDPLSGRFATWLVLAFAAYSLVFWLPRCLRRQKPRRVVRFAAAGLTLLAIVFLAARAHPARVGANPLIRGRVPDSRQRYCLLVKPMASDTCWVQGPVLADAGGRFEGMAHIGGFGRFSVIVVRHESGREFACDAGDTLPVQQVFQSADYACRTVLRIE